MSILDAYDFDTIVTGLYSFTRKHNRSLRVIIRVVGGGPAVQISNNNIMPYDRLTTMVDYAVAQYHDKPQITKLPPQGRLVAEGHKSRS